MIGEWFRQQDNYIENGEEIDTDLNGRDDLIMTDDPEPDGTIFSAENLRAATDALTSSAQQVGQTFSHSYSYTETEYDLSTLEALGFRYDSARRTRFFQMTLTIDLSDEEISQCSNEEEIKESLLRKFYIAKNEVDRKLSILENRARREL